MAQDIVKVPKDMEGVFSAAQEYVGRWFSDIRMVPEEGVIHVGDERYIIVRAASVSVHFLEFIQALYPALEPVEARDAASRVLYDMAHNIGRADARHFHGATRMTEPLEKLSTGPIHFAYTGWAKVVIYPESRTVPDDGFLLVYDHQNSFEADAWLAKRGKVDFCTCFMNAGYSAGWCTESFGMPLDAREVTCRSKGDPSCSFVMAPREHIARRLAERREGAGPGQ